MFKLAKLLADNDITLKARHYEGEVVFEFEKEGKHISFIAYDSMSDEDYYNQFLHPAMMAVV